MEIDWDKINDYAHDDAMMVALCRKYCYDKNCALHLKIFGSSIQAWIAPDDGYDIPPAIYEGATISHAISKALIGWLKANYEEPKV